MWGCTDLQNDCSNSLGNFGTLWRGGVWAPFSWIPARCCCGVDLNNSISWFLLSLWLFSFVCLLVFPTALLKGKANTLDLGNVAWISCQKMPRTSQLRAPAEDGCGCLSSKVDHSWNIVPQTGGILSPPPQSSILSPQQPGGEKKIGVFPSGNSNKWKIPKAPHWDQHKCVKSWF